MEHPKTRVRRRSKQQIRDHELKAPRNPASNHNGMKPNQGGYAHEAAKHKHGKVDSDLSEKNRGKPSRCPAGVHCPNR